MPPIACVDDFDTRIACEELFDEDTELEVQDFARFQSRFVETEATLPRFEEVRPQDAAKPAPVLVPSVATPSRAVPPAWTSADASSPKSRSARTRQTVCQPTDENVLYTRDFRKRLRELAGNTFVSLLFVKKDGTLRRMVARLGVGAKRLSDGDAATLAVARDAQSKERYALLTVWDVNAPNPQGGKGDYRCVNLQTLLELRVRGQVIIQNPAPVTAQDIEAL